MSKTSTPPATSLPPDIWEAVLLDIADRRQRGMAQYGVPLTTATPVDTLQAAYEEALDLVVYLRTEIEKRATNRPTEPVAAAVEKEQRMVIRCLVAGQGNAGPTFALVRVSCSQKDYRHGRHYYAAKAFADLKNPDWVCDEHDPASFVFLGINESEWEASPRIDIHGHRI